MIQRLFILSLFLGTFGAPIRALTNITADSSRMLVHLLSYIRADYGGAVRNGKVLSAPEYTEQLDFLKQAGELSQLIPELKGHREFQAKFALFRSEVEQKKSAADVSKLAGELEQQAIALAKIEITPQRWPDLHSGKRIFDRQCAQCHGTNGNGDGIAGKKLQPPPTNFHSDKMNELPPFQAYNTIRLGVPGTGMASFMDLSPRETWDVAFYVISLRYQNPNTQLDTTVPTSITLKEVATTSDADLRAKFAADVIRDVRLHEERNEAGFYFEARRLLTQVLDQAKAGDWAAAKMSAVASYLDGIEPMEPKLRRENPALVIEIEVKMAQVRKAIDLKSPELTELVRQADRLVVRAATESQQGVNSAGLAFGISFGIITREALEAILILMTILGITRALGSRSATLAIHAGWIAAILLGGATWVVANTLIKFSGADREWIEGFVAFIAVVMLIYMGFWLHNKTEIGKWREFVDKMTKTALEKRSLLAFGLLSFTAVYRETFESVLFLQALSLEVGAGQGWAILLGAATALGLMAALAMTFSRLSVRIPIRQLCQVSSWTMVILAVILLGKGVHSFQEVGIVPMTLLPVSLRFDLLGVFPTYETWAAQVAGLIIIVSLYFIRDRARNASRQTF